MNKYLEFIKHKISFIKLEYIFLITLFLISSYTRFKDLGYSDYIGDEHKSFIELKSGESLSSFFMTRRKGPMQFLVSQIPYLITQDFRNEYIQRTPFAVLSIIAVFAFYFLVKKISKNTWVSFLAAFFYSTNGFIVGFGRIAQYQNLNLLFNFLSLYFYLSLIEIDSIRHFSKGSYKDIKKIYIHTFLGTLFYCLSILSHWDGIFILPMIIYIFGRFLLNKSVLKTHKIRILLFNFILGCMLILPFMIPYAKTQLIHSENKDYFERRISMGVDNTNLYILLFELYNPFLTIYLVSIFSLFGFINIKRNWILGVWFLFGFGIFELFVRKPGTHIYNFIIPLFILSGYGIYYVFVFLVNLSKTKLISKFLPLKFIVNIIKYFYILSITLSLSFLLYQTYFIYIDHSIEYPWNKKIYFSSLYSKEMVKKYKFIKKLPVLETSRYTIDQKLPLFGFPHKRYWNEINEYINYQNLINNENYGYITNEDKTISEWYMDAKYKSDGGYYVVGIKKPLNFVSDYNFPQIGHKTLIITKTNDRGEVLYKIFKVNEQNFK